MVSIEIGMNPVTMMTTIGFGQKMAELVSGTILRGRLQTQCGKYAEMFFFSVMLSILSKTNPINEVVLINQIQLLQLWTGQNFVAW